MTFTEFFLKQTPKQIKEKFREIGLDKYYNIPGEKKDLCKLLDLEDDGLCYHYYVIKRWSAAETYMHFHLPNPADPEKPIDLEVDYYFKSAKGACSVSFGLESHVDIFEKVSTIFDDRPEYNNIEFRVWKESLPEIFNEKPDEWNEKKKYYVMKEGLTIWNYYEALANYATGVKPLLDMFVTAAENGDFEKTWNKLKPHDKWNRGDETFHAMFFPVVMNYYYKAVRAGVTPNIEDFTMLFAVSDEASNNREETKPLKEALSKLSEFNTTNEEILEGYNFAINFFKQKHLVDNSLQKWADLYVDANKELLKEVTDIKNKLSKKYGINEKWLRCVCFFDKPRNVKWDTDFVPEDAYVTTK